jgi:hypothetical protein
MDGTMRRGNDGSKTKVADASRSIRAISASVGTRVISAALFRRWRHRCIQSCRCHIDHAAAQRVARTTMARTAAQPTITSAATAPAVIFAFCLPVVEWSMPAALAGEIAIAPRKHLQCLRAPAEAGLAGFVLVVF